MSIKITMVPYMSAMAYASGHAASDYQSDMLYHGLKSLPDVEIQQIPYPWHMHKDAPKEQLKLIWGKGMTLYGLLEEDKVIFPIEDSDLIIVPLHHTMCHSQEGYGRYIQDIVQTFKIKTIAVDGWDQPDYLEQTASLVPYFKRELYDDRVSALPIFFAIPEEKIYRGELHKYEDFSPMVPANYSWGGIHTSNYKYETEEEYYKQYRESYFGYSCRKGGFATGRQNEVISQGCIPYITDIEIYPKNCLFRYPKDLCIEAKKMKGVYPGTLSKYDPKVSTYIGDTRQIKEGKDRGYIDHNIFNHGQYWDLLGRFQDYLSEHLTTKALAKYVLEKSL